MFIVSYIVGPFWVERRGGEGRGGDVLELFAKSAGLSVSTLIKQKIKNQSKAIFFKELRHNIYQNSNKESCYQIVWNIKVLVENIQRRYE